MTPSQQSTSGTTYALLKKTVRGKREMGKRKRKAGGKWVTCSDLKFPFSSAKHRSHTQTHQTEARRGRGQEEVRNKSTTRVRAKHQKLCSEPSSELTSSMQRTRDNTETYQTQCGYFQIPCVCHNFFVAFLRYLAQIILPKLLLTWLFVAYEYIQLLISKITI